ncbi:PP2C family serine/threonine-protein phosphatase [Endozoicomonas sp. OPT23]|uniref:PP2C family serine/threonine-protein phosphatase n=1 Tax=Endozoicomonas sp. OPT23 TaxID=2072845 RepID=UPI001891890A|nr:PP2C family protein-serine/threonine phosphatase [Endozoicomonas sp. OPT23]
MEPLGSADSNIDLQAKSLMENGVNEDEQLGMTSDGRLVTKQMLDSEHKKSWVYSIPCIGPWFVDSFESCQSILLRKLKGKVVGARNLNLKTLLTSPADWTMGLSEAPVISMQWQSENQLRSRDVNGRTVNYLRQNRPVRSPSQPSVGHETINALDFEVTDNHEMVHERIKQANAEAYQFHKSQKQEECFGQFKAEGKLADAELKSMKGYEEKSSQLFENSAVVVADGSRPYMEDRHLEACFTFQAGDKKIPVAMIAVFDGHGGDKAAVKAVKEMKERLKERLEYFNSKGLSETGIEEALRLVMVVVDREIINHGTTACLSAVIAGQLWTSNVGDSRALVQRKDNKDNCLPLSKDIQAESLVDLSQYELPGEGEFYLEPDDSEYGKALVDRGGLLSCKMVNGYPDVRIICKSSSESRFKKLIRKAGQKITGKKVAKKQHLELQPAKTLGDHNLAGASSPTGIVTCHKLDPKMDKLVVGCDGVFDVMTSETLTDYLSNHQDESSLEQCRQLAGKAYYADPESSDNLTLMVYSVKGMVERMKKLS